jgi:hypothetical protein
LYSQVFATEKAKSRPSSETGNLRNKPSEAVFVRSGGTLRAVDGPLGCAKKYAKPRGKAV